MMALLKKYFTAAFAAAILITIVGIGCTKLDTTTQGADILIVDNINTFEDTMYVTSSQGIFTNDSTLIRKNENHIIGRIDNDPFFGKTEAAIYVQFKPTFYPFYFGNAGDTVKNGTSGNASPVAGFDSAFICLSYKGAWGDTSISNINQNFQVRTILDDDFRVKTDTVRKLNYQLTGLSLGPVVSLPTTITPQKIAAFSKLNKGLFRDSVNNQIRIKLDPVFAAAIFNGQDSTSTGTNNAFYNDSLFRRKFNGFAITSTVTGNTLFYVNLAEAKSRLEFHYHKTKAGVRDTLVQSFQMYSTAPAFNVAASSSANYLKRDYGTTDVTLNQTASNPFIYLQSSPGTYANIKIPKLTSYTNRIVHRAYLIVDEAPYVPTVDKYFTPPPYLYVDLKDTSLSVPQKYKPLYFDLSNQFYNPDAASSPDFFPANNVDINVLGGVALLRYDVTTGLPYYGYEINITRYVQHIITNGFYNYDLRLFAPSQLYYPQYTGPQFTIPYFNPTAVGRVRVVSGNASISNTHRMRLRIIYSKI
jgi:Domain of unknown function (DUF4270)